MTNTKRNRLRERLAWWQGHLKRLMEAHTALVEGGVRSFQIENRRLTQFDISDLLAQILAAEKKIDELEALLSGSGARKAVGVILRDW